MAGLPNRGLKGIATNAERNQVFLLKQGIMIVVVLFVFCTFLKYSAFSQILANSFSYKISRVPGKTVISALVHIKGNVDVSGYIGKRSKVLTHLSDQTKNYQKNLEKYLQEEHLKGTVKHYRQFWIANLILVEGQAEVLKAIEKRTDVNYLQENFTLSLPETQDSQSFAATAGCEWGIDTIEADRVWETYGFKGNGVKVGHLDTGVDGTHDDLAGKISRWARIDSYGNVIADNNPVDSGYHGTHTAGIIAGGNSGGSYIGVAPEAQLVSAMVLNGGSGTFAQLLGGIEWIIDPDGNPETDDSVDVVNLSLGATGMYEEFIEPVDNLIAAGIFPSFSIGNSGPESSSSPGNIPEGFGVGAVNSSHDVAYFSSGEVVEWHIAPYIGMWTKPDVSAPGVSVKSSVPGGYSWLSGTSMAAPHVTGTVALIKQANPNLTVSQIKTILAVTSKDLGESGKDTRYGWGLINAYEAVCLAISGDIPNDISDYDPEKPWAYVVSPKPNQSIWGDAVTVVAGATVNTSRVRFEYKKISGYSPDGWVAMKEDNKPPFSMYWDVTSLPQGVYRIRAVAYNREGNESSESSGISVMVYAMNSDIVESGDAVVNPLAAHSKKEKVDANRSSEIVVADGTAVIIPAGTLSASTELNVNHLLPDEVLSKLPPPEASLYPVGIFREFTFTSGEHLFPQDLTIFLPYVDDNDDGIIDGTSIHAQNLKIFYLKEDKNGNPLQWVEIDTEGSVQSAQQARKLSPIVQNRKGVSFTVNHFTLFAVMAYAPKLDLNEVIVYPNPVRPNQAGGRQDVTFDNLTENVRLRIFTLAGRIVRDIENIDSAYTWDLRNEQGEDIQSGVYFYLAADDHGRVTKGKFAVIR